MRTITALTIQLDLRLDLTWKDCHLKLRASASLLTNPHLGRSCALITPDCPRDGDYKSISSRTDVVPPCKHGPHRNPNFERQQQHEGEQIFSSVRGSTAHANHSVNQSAAEPKHTQQTEQNRKLTDGRKRLIRLFLVWPGFCAHCNNILTTTGRSNIAVMLFPNHFAAY